MKLLLEIDNKIKFVIFFSNLNTMYINKIREIKLYPHASLTRFSPPLFGSLGHNTLLWVKNLNTTIFTFSTLTVKFKNYYFFFFLLFLSPHIVILFLE